jgi:hypothetical protein
VALGAVVVGGASRAWRGEIVATASLLGFAVDVHVVVDVDEALITPTRRPLVEAALRWRRRPRAVAVSLSIA